MTMAETRSSEAGFTLIEVLVSVGLVALALAGTLTAVISLALVPRQTDVRTLALQAAQNVLVRARAVSAYYPRPANPGATLAPDYANPVQLPLSPASSYDTVVARAVPQPTGTP